MSGFPVVMVIPVGCWVFVEGCQCVLWIASENAACGCVVVRFGRVAGYPQVPVPSKSKVIVALVGAVTLIEGAAGMVRVAAPVPDVCWPPAVMVMVPEPSAVMVRAPIPVQVTM